MIVTVPLMQLLLFGYAINTTPRDLPTAVLLQENSDLGALGAQGAGEHHLLQGHPPGPQRGRVRPPAGRRARCCSRSRSRATSSVRCGAATSRRCWSRPTRPTRWPPARRWARCDQLVQTALEHDRAICRQTGTPPFEIRTHARYNPAALDAAQHRAGAGRHHPHHDHADLHRRCR